MNTIPAAIEENWKFMEKNEKYKAYVVGMGINAGSNFFPKISWKFCLHPKLNASFCGPFVNIGARNDSNQIQNIEFIL